MSQIIPTEAPWVEPYQVAIPAAPVEIDGQLYQQWQIVNTPPDQDRINHDRNYMWEQVKEWRTRITAGGVYCAGKWWHSDQSSRTQWLGLLILGANVPAIEWKTMDNTKQVLSPVLVQQVFSAMLVHEQTAFNVAEAHRTSILNHNRPLEYDISAGWPSIYGG